MNQLVKSFITLRNTNTPSIRPNVQNTTIFKYRISVEYVDYNSLDVITSILQHQ